MKSFSIALLLIFVLSSSYRESEQLVKDYLTESNNYNFETASSFLDVNYNEIFVDGSVEIENLDQLKEFMKWRKIMDSKSSLLSLKSSQDTVITVEKIYHFMDKILERKPRTFKIKYVVRQNKILKSIIDTVPGHSEITGFNYAKFAQFQEFSTAEGLELDMGMTADGALQLRKALELYKNSR